MTLLLSLDTFIATLQDTNNSPYSCNIGGQLSINLMLRIDREVMKDVLKRYKADPKNDFHFQLEMCFLFLLLSVAVGL